MINSIYLFTLPACALSHKKDDYTKAVEYAYQKVLDAYSKLEKKAGSCRKEKINASDIKHKLPVIPSDKSGKKMAVAIGFLSNRNYFRCIYHEEAGLLFQIHSYEQLISRAREQGLSVDDPYARDYSGIRKSIIGLPLNSLSEVDYMALPESTRKQFESIEELQNQNFNAIRLLEDLDMLPKTK